MVVPELGAWNGSAGVYAAVIVTKVGFPGVAVKVTEQLAELGPVDESVQLGGVKKPQLAGLQLQEIVPVGGSEKDGGTGVVFETVAVHVVDL